MMWVRSKSKEIYVLRCGLDLYAFLKRLYRRTPSRIYHNWMV